MAKRSRSRCQRRSVAGVTKNLDKQVAKGKLPEDDKTAIQGRVSATTDLDALAELPDDEVAARLRRRRLRLAQWAVRRLYDAPPLHLARLHAFGEPTHRERVEVQDAFAPPPAEGLKRGSRGAPGWRRPSQDNFQRRRFRQDSSLSKNSS